MSDEKTIRLGYAAKALLDNDDFRMFMDSVRVTAWKAWSTSQPEELAKREDNYQLLRAITLLTENMETLASNASFEEKKAELEARKANKEQPKGE